MSSFPDASFLCALYRAQENSDRADRYFSGLDGPLAVSSLLLLEFRQSTRLQGGLHKRDKTKGFSVQQGRQMLADLESDLDSGVLSVRPVEWVEVHSVAEQLSERHTVAGCHRMVDILHVATALHLKAAEFLTLDSNQEKLAKAAGLTVPLERK